MAFYDWLFGVTLFSFFYTVAPQTALPVIGNPPPQFDWNSQQFKGQAQNEISLYSPTSPVLTLNWANFVQTIFVHGPEKTAYFVNFYADWCAHCRTFVPEWEKLAARIKNWSGLVKIAAVNCAQRENEFLCLSNNIEAYPSLKYFPRNSRHVTDGNKTHIVFEQARLKQALIDFILDEYVKNNYENWPNFNILPNTNDITQLWNYIPHTDEYTHLGLVFENDYDKYLAVKILLDFSSTKLLKIRRVRFDNPLAVALRIETFPAFVLLERRKNQILYKTEYRKSLLLEVEKILRVNNGKVTVPPYVPSTSTKSPPATTLSSKQLKAKFVISETDLLLAARFSLFEAITSAYLEISGAKLQSLKNYVNLYAQYFPPISQPVQKTLGMFGVKFSEKLERSERAKVFFKDLYDFLIDRGNKTLKREEWIEKFTRLETMHGSPFPTNQGYVHCRGSEPKFRGYTCGLWTVFHALTVNAFYERGFMKNFDSLWILKSIQGYVENFFGCADCATHFVDMATRSFRMEDFVQKADDVVLYMWNAHNIVNKRLAGDAITEDPSMPKMQFPPDFLCPTCRNVKNSGRWNETSVMQFLSNYYGSGIKAHVNNPLLSKFH